MSKIAAFLLLSFLFKMLNIALLSRILQKYFDSVLESFLSAWLILQTALYFWMLVFSLPKEITQASMWGFLAVSFFITAGFYCLSQVKIPVFKLSSDETDSYFSKPAITAIVLGVLVFIFLFYRSLFFFDNTWDALTYELTRIFFYAHYQTLFVIQPTQALNIFANEWNGELNALFYVLVTANSQASSFGNVEIWFFSFLCFAYVLGEFGVPNKFKLLFGWAVATAPALLGLAMTTKGDLLSIATFVLGFVFLLKSFIKKCNPVYLIVTVLALGMSSGAKISVVPEVGLLLIFLFCHYFKISKETCLHKIMFSIGCFTLACINNSRYVVNIFAYHSPFKHMESTSLTFEHVIGNAEGIFISIFNLHHKIMDNYVLSESLYLVTLMFFLWLLYVVICYYRIHKINMKNQLSTSISKKIERHEFWLAVILMIIGLFILMISIKWQPWSFRYFLAWVILAMLMIVGYSCKYVTFKSKSISIIISFIVICGFINLEMVSKRAVDAFPVSLYRAQNQSQIERETEILGNMFEQIAIKIPGFLNPKKNILILNEPDSMVSPFFGKNYSNSITLVNSDNMLLDKLQKKKYDFVIFTGHPLVLSPLANSQVLKKLGYVMAFSKEDLISIYASITPDKTSK